MDAVLALHPVYSLLFMCVQVFRCSHLACIQVFKGIKNGVQDVAVKVLINSDDIQVQMFQEVRPLPHNRYYSCNASRLMLPGIN